MHFFAANKRPILDSRPVVERAAANLPKYSIVSIQIGPRDKNLPGCSTPVPSYVYRIWYIVKTVHPNQDSKPEIQSASSPLSNKVPAASQYPQTTKFCQDAQLHRRVYC